MSLLLETNCGWSLGLMQHQSRTMAAVWKFPFLGYQQATLQDDVMLINSFRWQWPHMCCLTGADMLWILQHLYITEKLQSLSWNCIMLRSVVLHNIAALWPAQ